jgi:hypothetical protein
MLFRKAALTANPGAHNRLFRGEKEYCRDDVDAGFPRFLLVPFYIR